MAANTACPLRSLRDPPWTWCRGPWRCRMNRGSPLIAPGWGGVRRANRCPIPFDKPIPLHRANTMAAQLWGGVIFLIALGLLLTYNFQRFVRGRYFAEWHSEGAINVLMGVIRWCWAIIWAVGAILSFLGAFWLAKYTLSQFG